MKERIKKLCVWFLSKYYPITMKNIEISGNSYTFEFGGYIPDDKNWHHVAMTLEAWLKIENKDALFDSVKMFTDGEQKAEYRFEVPTAELK